MNFKCPYCKTVFQVANQTVITCQCPESIAKEAEERQRVINFYKEKEQKRKTK